MAQQDYAVVFLFVDGAKAGQITHVSMNTESGKIPIYTLGEGLSGFSPGPGEVNFTINYVIPVGGFEIPFQNYAAESGRHTVQFGLGPIAYTGEGEFMTDAIDGGVQKATEGTCTFKGQKKPME